MATPEVNARMLQATEVQPKDPRIFLPKCSKWLFSEPCPTFSMQCPGMCKA